MAIRLLQVTVPAGREGEVAEHMEGQGAFSSWHHPLGADRGRAGALVRYEDTESILDDLDRRLAGIEPREVVMLPVEACIPRAPDPEDLATVAGAEVRPRGRVSREELYQDIAGTTRLDGDFLPLVVLSAIVAAVGLTTGDIATIIGAMVIAPLLGPNMALALAVALGDLALGVRALRCTLAGVSVAFLFAFAVAKVFPVDPAAPAIAARTGVGLGNLLVALSAGVAGTLAFTSGAPSNLIGVMVAVALLPPLVVCGMLLSEGHLVPALGAAELVLGNVISVNLAAVATFVALGVRPRRWWEAERARRATRVGLALWTGLLVVLLLLALFGPTAASR